jgi:predicted transposase/invertase (TIGR01784 family)
MMQERLNPLNDYMFLKIMGEKGDEEQLCAFINAVLGRKGGDAIMSVEILENRTITAEIAGDKSSILDVRAVTAAGERINIQEKFLNYATPECCYAINIVNYEFMPDVPDFHLSFHIWEDRYRDVLLTDALEIHFIDMVKFRRLKEKDIRNDPLHRWLTWLDQDSPEGQVEEAVKMDVAIRKAEEKMAYVASDKEALRAYQMRAMALSDMTSGLNHAREEGIQQGIQKGIQERGREIASRMKERGVHVDQIVEYTGLSLEEIGQI